MLQRDLKKRNWASKCPQAGGHFCRSHMLRQGVSRLAGEQTNLKRHETCAKGICHNSVTRRELVNLQHMSWPDAMT